MSLFPFGKEHLDEWEALEPLCFSDPWTRSQMEEIVGREGYISLALMLEGRLAGYACMYHILGDGNITNIAVHPEFRGRGFGGKLLDGLMEKAEGLGLARLMLEARESNAPAIALYASRGFERVGLRRGYYQKPSEDAILMTKRFKQGDCL